MELGFSQNCLHFLNLIFMKIYTIFSFRFLADTFHFLADYKIKKRLRNGVKISKSQAICLKNRLKHLKKCYFMRKKSLIHYFLCIKPMLSICIGKSIEIRFHFSNGSFILLQIVSNEKAR